jgi:hypothetical protein
MFMNVGAGFSRPIVVVVSGSPGLVVLAMRHAAWRMFEPPLLQQFRTDAIRAHDERLLAEPGQLRMRQRSVKRDSQLQSRFVAIDGRGARPLRTVEGPQVAHVLERGLGRT